MKRSTRPALYLLFAFLTFTFLPVISQIPESNGVIEYNYPVPDVISAFKNLTVAGEGLCFHLPGTVHDEFLVLDPFKTHIQGMTRSARAGKPLFFIGVSANNHHPDEDFYDEYTFPGILVFEGGSRPQIGERVRSNRLERDEETTFTQGPSEDQVVQWYESPCGHPSGMGMVGDILAVPGCSQVEFFNTIDTPFQLVNVLENQGGQAGGITNLPDGRFMLIFNGGPDNPVHFYWSNKTSFFDDSGPEISQFTDEFGEPVSEYVLDQNGSATAYLRIVDTARNTVDTINKIQIIITATSTGDKETYTIYETGTDTDTFAHDVNELLLAMAVSNTEGTDPNDSILHISDAEFLTVSYPFTFDPNIDPKAKYRGFTLAELEDDLTPAYYEYWPYKDLHGNKKSHQSVSPVVQGEGESARLFVIGFCNSDPFSPVWEFEGDDEMFLLEITNFQEGKEDFVTLVPVPNGKKTVNLRNSATFTSNLVYSYAEIDPDLEIPVPKIFEKNWQGNFNAGAYAYTSPSGELICYGAHHFADGPGHTVKIAELRHKNVVRNGSPTYSPTAVPGGPYGVDEGSTIPLDGSMSRTASAAPWAHFFEHNNFGGRSIMIDYEDYDLDDYDNFGKLDGQCSGLDFGIDLQDLEDAKNSLLSKMQAASALTFEDLTWTFNAGSKCDWACGEVIGCCSCIWPANVPCATCKGLCDVFNGINIPLPDWGSNQGRQNWARFIDIYEPLLILIDDVVLFGDFLIDNQCDLFSIDNLPDPPAPPASLWVFDTSHVDYKGLFTIEANNFEDFLVEVFTDFGVLTLDVIDGITDLKNTFLHLPDSLEAGVVDLYHYAGDLVNYVEYLIEVTRGFNNRASSVRWNAPAGMEIVLYEMAGHEGDSLILEGTGYVEQFVNLGTIPNTANWNDRPRSMKFNFAFSQPSLVAYDWTLVTPPQPVPLSILNSTAMTSIFDATFGDGPTEATVELDVGDSAGRSGHATAAVQVINVPPVVEFDRLEDQTGTDIAGFVPLLLEAVEYTLFANYSDAGILDTHSAYIDWGDDSTNASGDGILLNMDCYGGVPGEVEVPHTYATQGQFLTTMIVEDKDGAIDQFSRYIQVEDALGATQVCITHLLDILNDAGFSAWVAYPIWDARDKLQGNQGGSAANGVLQELANGNLNSAMIKIKQALSYLEEAIERDPGLVDYLGFVQRTMTLTAKSVAMKAILEAEILAQSANDLNKIAAAYVHIDDGGFLQISGDYEGAANTYREAFNMVLGII